MTEMGSLEFASLSPASSIRQRVRYSIGDAPDRLFEFQGEGRSRHAGALRQFLQCPAMRRIVVHGVDRRAHLFVRQGEEPADAAAQPFRQMQPQGLNQHHVGECCATRKPPGCGSRSSCIIRSRDQRSAALSDSFRICTMGGSTPNRMPA